MGHGFDAHRLVAGRPFILGGVTVEFPSGPFGHSDADVLVHAIADALLGACALGDLGAHFPDTDLQWAGANSCTLLRASYDMVTKAGFHLVNIDATVVVQAPRLAPYLEAMRARLALTLDVDVSAISVKAKTSEGLGYTGDGTGISAYAVAMVSRP